MFILRHALILLYFANFEFNSAVCCAFVNSELDFSRHYSISSDVWLKKSGIFCLSNSQKDLTDAVEEDSVGVISYHEAKSLLTLTKPFREESSNFEVLGNPPIGTIEASIDLGKSKTQVSVLKDGIGLIVNEQPVILATWDELDMIVSKAKKGQYHCYQLFADGKCKPQKISAISATTGNPAMLCAPMLAPGAPTMVLGGFTMHRITGQDKNKGIMCPAEDTANKIKAAGLGKVHGHVLDTCLGLGYTAILASKCPGVTRVTTIEYDDVSIEMCRCNPWSSEIFEDPSIELIHGDACEVVKQFPDKQFAGIIHDPPALALCKTSGMYGLEFYSQLWRVLKPGATMFHYIGNPESKESGRLYKGIIDRLYKAGFSQVLQTKKAFGISAKKM